MVAAVAAEVGGGCTTGTVLLRWALQKNVAVIPKSLRVERVAQSMEALDAASQLSVAQVARLDALADERRGVYASIEAHQRIIASAHYAWTPT